METERPHEEGRAAVSVAEAWDAAAAALSRLIEVFRDSGDVARKTADAFAEHFTPVIVEWTKTTPAGRAFMAKETKRIRYDRKVAKMRMRLSDARMMRPTDDATGRTIEPHPQLVREAANIRAKAARDTARKMAAISTESLAKLSPEEQEKRLGAFEKAITSLPVPEPPPIVVVKPENLDREMDKIILGVTDTPTGAVSPEKE